MKYFSGETILISRNDFGFMDDDDSDDHLRITLLANPVHGQLVYKELNVVMEGNIITQDDINKNFIRFVFVNTCKCLYGQLFTPGIYFDFCQKD